MFCDDVLSYRSRMAGLGRRRETLLPDVVAGRFDKRSRTHPPAMLQATASCDLANILLSTLLRRSMKSSSCASVQFCE